jgi:hypothetical protein
MQRQISRGQRLPRTGEALDYAPGDAAKSAAL